MVLPNSSKTSGRKPITKSWDARYSHNFRSNYETDAAVHILMFLAGEHCSDLIESALNSFAARHGIPVQDPEFQQSVFIQASSMHATNRRPPIGSEVMEVMGRTDILQTLALAIGKDSENLQPAPPRTAVVPKPKAYVPLAAPAPQILSASPPAKAPVATIAITSTREVQTTSTEAQTSSAQAAHVPSPESKPRKPMVNIDMGPEIDIDSSGSGERNGTDSVKNRWLAAHDY